MLIREPEHIAGLDVAVAQASPVKHTEAPSDLRYRKQNPVTGLSARRRRMASGHARLTKALPASAPWTTPNKKKPHLLPHARKLNRMGSQGGAGARRDCQATLQAMLSIHVRTSGILSDGRK